MIRLKEIVLSDSSVKSQLIQMFDIQKENIASGYDKTDYMGLKIKSTTSWKWNRVLTDLTYGKIKGVTTQYNGTTYYQITFTPEFDLNDLDRSVDKTNWSNVEYKLKDLIKNVVDEYRYYVRY